jgi:anti-sigma factor RsiW
MRCSDATRQLQLYIDHRLPLQQMRPLEAHISSCTTCHHELMLLEEVATSLRTMQLVVEPTDLTARIMQRVAEHPRWQRKGGFSLLRPSFMEMLAVFFLATITTLGFIWNQPALRAMLPFTNGHGVPAQSFLNMLSMLAASNAGPLMLALWVVGAIIGIWITLALVGDEMRTEWLRAMLDRLPVR